MQLFFFLSALEFAYSEAPKSLQGVIMGMFMLAVGLGTYFGAAFIALVDTVTEKINGKDGKWYPDKQYINKSHHFAYYFFLLAGLMFTNFLVYVFVARSFQNNIRMAKNSLNVSRAVPVRLNLSEPPSSDDTNNQTSGMADGLSSSSGQTSRDVD